MDTIQRSDIVSIINNYAFDNDIQPVVECLNTLLANQDYRENLDLIFMSIAATQMYGFLSYLTYEEQQQFFECDYFRSNSYRGVEIPFYNRGQLSLLYELEQYQKVFFSAPTSFGKTSIVNEYILNNSKNLDNVLFVVPTNSLLEELFEKFTLYSEKLKLHYNVTTQPQNSLQGRNILLLTPERFMLIAESQTVNQFDLIVMDETYKIVESQNESISDFVNHRSLRFRKAADIIAKANTKIVFLSPFTYTLTTSMSDFLTRHGIKKIDRKLEYVKRQIIKIESSDEARQYFGERLTHYQKTTSLSQKANLLLSKLHPSSTIVYVPNYAKAYEIASKNSFSCLLNMDNSRYIAFLEHIKDNFLVDGKESWSVYEALKNGIGIYIAPLPRYVKKEIIKLYESKVLSTLIVTTAFTEGVNTCASNLVFTSLVNGPNTNKLSDIDVLNVSGRAGRFSKNTIGKVFCITKDIFDRVSELQNAHDIKLENYNYKKIPNRLDYEIEMIGDEYLNEMQKQQLLIQAIEIQKLGLTKQDLNISLNVSNNWKTILYKHFLNSDTNTVQTIYSKIKAIYDQEDRERVQALSYIFKDLHSAFSNEDINVFPQEPYEISPFDKKGEFTWARLYQIYVSGSPKKIVANNIEFITSRFQEITSGHRYTDKTHIETLFDSQNAKWILKYYNSDLSLNMNAFYAETFKIVSNIIQYKIPFYLIFYVAIFKLFLKKNNNGTMKPDDFDINGIINIFEDGESPEEYSKLIDYGLPFSTVGKISDFKLSVEDLKAQRYDHSKFDDYENIIIGEILPLL